MSLDGQFQILTPDAQRVIVSVPRGLAAVYNGMAIQYVFECFTFFFYSTDTRVKKAQ